MPEAKISIIPGTKNEEVVVTFPGFKSPGHTIEASLYSTEEQKRAAILWLSRMGLRGDYIKSELESGKIVKW